MKRNNQKRGFTIIELVIVIAVIAILAAVLIPTFSGVKEKAEKSAAEQEAQSLYTTVLALDLSDGVIDKKDGNSNIDTVEGKKLDTNFTYTPNKGGTAIDKFVYDCDNGYTATYENGKWTSEKTTTNISNNSSSTNGTTAGSTGNEGGDEG